MTSFDPKPELREFIHENLGLAAIHAGLAQDYAALGDDVGLGYALRRYVAYTRCAIDAFKDLATIESPAARTRGEAA